MRIRARGIVPGRASGMAILSPAPFSFVGGVDPATGSIADAATGIAGERLRAGSSRSPPGKEARWARTFSTASGSEASVRPRS